MSTWKEGILLVFIGILATSSGQDCMVTVEGTSEVKPCIFPWTFNGNEYASCIPDQDDSDRKLYCITEKLEDGIEAILGQWGYCPESCSQLKVNSNNPDLGTWKPDGGNGECGGDAVASSIVGGKEAKRGEFPYMALLGRKIPPSDPEYEKLKELGFTVDGVNDLESFECGGSIINKWYVLTAGHCIRLGGKVTYTKENGLIVLGEHAITQKENPNAIRRKPSKIILHENWDQSDFPQFSYDIALIRVDEKIPTENYFFAQPVCLPWNGEAKDLSPGQSLTATGWGATKEGGFTSQFENILYSQDVLLKTTVNLLDNSDSVCYNRVDTAICADDQTGDEKLSDSCQGDSGGPLVFKEIGGSYYQVGVVSYGTGCARVGEAGYYTEVVQFLDWIESKLEK